MVVIKKVYPKVGDMQLHRLEEAVEFVCENCKKTKKSKTAAIIDGWETVICNGCYGNINRKNQSL